MEQIILEQIILKSRFRVGILSFSRTLCIFPGFLNKKFHIFSRAGNSFLFFSGFLEVVGPLVVYFLSVVRRRLVRVAMEFFSWTIFYQI